MKVLYIIDSLQGSGAERSLVDIAINLKQFQPVFVHLYEGDMLKEMLQEHNIKVYSLNSSRKLGYSEIAKNLESIYQDEKPNLVHSTLYNSDRVARILKKKFPTIPLVGSFVNNSYTPLRYKNKSVFMRLKLWRAFFLDKVTSKYVDFYISNSDTIKRSEGDALKIPMNKIKVIYRGRKVERFENIDQNKVTEIKNNLNIQDKRILINVSRLIERKAQFDIINALPEVLKTIPNAVLLLAGHGNQENYLRNLSKSLNIEEHVIFLGRSTDIPELLNLSEVFVYPSYAEGLPGALIEAMMSKKIIIASNIGENMECVTKDSAIIFDKGNVKELGDSIVYALNNMDKLNVKAEMAKKQAIEKFDIENISSQYDETYSQVLKNTDKNA